LNQDFVDILIAWHIDCSQPDEIVEFISNTLVKLRPYWLRDLNFTLMLLMQFVEDIENCTQVSLKLTIYFIIFFSNINIIKVDFDNIDKETDYILQISALIKFEL